MLPTISRDLDRTVLVRGTVIVLRRRLSDPAESPGVEIEELRDAAHRLHALVHPFAAPRNGPSSRELHQRFVASLTADQQGAMQHGGLPFSELSADQAALWKKIQEDGVFGTADRELQRLAQLLDCWPDATLERRDLAQPRQADLFARFPVPHEGGSDGMVDVRIPVVRRTPRVERAEVVRLAALPIDQADLQTRWTVAAQTLTLRELTQKWKAEGGPQLTVPAYAGDRRVLIGCAQARRGDVLRALCDLWGWEFRRVGEEYQMGPPAVPPGTAVSEVPAALLASVPPPLRQTVQAVLERATLRSATEGERISAAVAKLAAQDRAPVAISRLPPELQISFADLAFTHQVAAGLELLWNTEFAAPLWLVHPEQGRLHLGGALLPGRQVLISLHVPVGENGDAMWGWVIGSGTPAVRR